MTEPEDLERRLREAAEQIGDPAVRAIAEALAAAAGLGEAAILVENEHQLAENAERAAAALLRIYADRGVPPTAEAMKAAMGADSWAFVEEVLQRRAELG